MNQQGRKDPLTLAANDDEQVAGSDTKKREVRSSSPAKRRASAMDDSPHMGATDQTATANGQQQTASTSSSSKQHTRETSVDMVASTNGSSGAASTNPSSVSATPDDQEMEDMTAEELPSIDEQVEIIKREVTNELPEDGAVGYIVASAWINRVLARSSEKDDHGSFEKDVLEGDVGPLDNSSVVARHASEELVDDKGEKFTQLRPGLVLNTDIGIFPKKAFDYAVKWYGLAPGQAPIKRYAHATNADSFDQNVQFELYPPIFALRKIQPQGMLDKHTTEDGRQKAPRIVASRSCGFQTFLKRAKEATGIPSATKVKLWRVLSPEAVATDGKLKVANGAAIPSPPESREASPSGLPTSLPLLIKSDAFKAMPEAVEREMIDAKDETNNDKYNDSLQLGTLGLAADQILILEEQASNGSFTSDAGKKATKGVKKGGLLSSTSSGRSSPALGPITRGRNRASGRTQGSVGLTNLGNTCYMNSALQCIRATEELTCFFLAKAWKKELNKGNPLGHEGKMAITYASLLDSIYDTNSSSFTPSDFKRMLSKCGPQFSGYGQQDSQEFMSFLVDALHEDMNRIHQKPYIENPDSDDNRVNDENYIKELGNTFRENYRKRNDSVIHDLFNGFYKNTMVCPDCGKISVTFDPYLLLTLQLPLEHSWQHTVTLLPLRGEPVKVDIDMDKHATIKQLKEYVSRKVPGMDANRLMMAEVFSKKFYRTVEDKQTIVEANIQPRDEMILYELDEAPTNFPTPKKKKKTNAYRTMLFPNDEDEEVDIPGDDDKMADVMMVPVFQRTQSAYGNSRSLVNTPFFITVNRAEARNCLEIYRKVLARIASLTTRDFIHELGSETASSSGDDAIEDEDSSSAVDADVQTRSVESEDGIVEVSLSNGATTNGRPADTSRPPESVLEPGAPIPPTLLDVFKLKILPKGAEMIPTGFQGVDEKKNLKLLSDRLPRVPAPAEDASSRSSESSDADDMTTSAQNSFANGDASDDDAFVKPKKQRTYGRESQKSQQNGQAAETVEGEPDYDAEPEDQILHLGESLIIDWSSENYDALFEGTSEDDLRGRARIGKDMATLVDKELNEKRKKRDVRKKTGISLDECFNVTAQGEILTEDNAWFCNRCKQLRQAKKTLEIWTAPDVLVIHLKRFSAARQFRDKIDVLVGFPTEGLSLNDKVGMTEGKDLTYDLFAVDNHYGGLGGGHYTAYAKNFVDGEWYEYNDSSVSKRQAEHVVTSAAYLLFYRRRSSQYLGSPDLRKIVSSFRTEEEATDSAADDEGGSESRTASPSGQGKGLRLGGSSFHASSSSSAGQGAGRQQRRGGDGLEAAQGRGTLVKSGAVGIPGLDGYEGDDDDEGFAEGMDEDADDVLPGNGFVGPLLPPYQQATSSTANGISPLQTWTWNDTDDFAQQLRAAAKGADSAAEDDVASNEAIHDIDTDTSMRTQEAFDDDVGAFGGGFDSAHHSSPIIQSTEVDPFLGADQMEEVQRFENLDELETVEIRIDSPPASGVHEKKE